VDLVVPHDACCRGQVSSSFPSARVFDQAVRDRRNLLGEDRDVFVLVVAHDEPFDHRQLDVREELARERVEVIDLGAVADPQNSSLVGPAEALALALAVGLVPADGAAGPQATTVATKRTASASLTWVIKPLPLLHAAPSFQRRYVRVARWPKDMPPSPGRLCLTLGEPGATG